MMRARLGVGGRLLGGSLLLLLLLPIATLALSSSLQELRAGVQHALFVPALGLSLRTTLASLAITVVTGTPMAFWLATSSSRMAATVEALCQLPIVVPPAVIGVALLQTFGRKGLLGPVLEGMGLGIPFTEAAVVIAQVVVSAPFFVQAAANAFRKLDLDVWTVARTLGASRAEAFWRVAIPIALPGLLAGASLAWARSLGEFGATLLFAGNMPGRTQTMPLAIFTALESDLRVAVALSLALCAMGVLLLVLLRAGPGLWRGRDARDAGRGGAVEVP